MNKFIEKISEDYEGLVSKTKQELKKRETPELPNLGSYFQGRFMKNIGKILAKELGSPASFWEESLELKESPAHVSAHAALALFKAAETLQKSPADLANSIVEAFKKNHPQELEKLEITGPFLNLYFKSDVLTEQVLNDVETHHDYYGWSDSGKGQTVLIDYSSPNIAKPIGIGHIRSTIIGQALANLYLAQGWSVIRDNFLGDWGTQFGKLLVSLNRWAPKDIKPEDLSFIELNKLYVKYHEEEEKDETLKKEADQLVERLENGDAELIRIWQILRDKSIEGFKNSYSRLGVSFDIYSGESYFVETANAVIVDCLTNGVCSLSKDSQAVFVEDLENLPSVILRKSDGTNLYLSRDLAALKGRVDKFSPHDFLYVVGEEQSLHFRQLFAIAKKLDYVPETNLKHISFGLVLVAGKKMSTRKGSLVELDALLDESIAKSLKLLEEKGNFEDETERKSTAKLIGVSAVVYNDLRQSRTRNISFDWDKMLNIQGGSSVYLQYTHARIKSIERKLKELVAGKTTNNKKPLLEKTEEILLVALSRFPSIVARAQVEQAPHHIATYLENLAHNFNTFYGEVRVVETEDPELRASRGALIASVAQVLKNGLQLLNIKVPERL